MAAFRGEGPPSCSPRRRIFHPNGVDHEVLLEPLPLPLGAKLPHGRCGNIPGFPCVCASSFEAFRHTVEDVLALGLVVDAVWLDVAGLQILVPLQVSARRREQNAPARHIRG